MDQGLQQPTVTSGELGGTVTIHAFARSRLSARSLAVIGLLALITGLAYFLHFKTTYQPDSPSYVVPAENLLRGRGFVAWDGYPETSRTPGYPLLIVPFLWAGLDLKYLIILQHLFRIVIILCTTAFTFSLTASFRQATVAGVLLCIDLPMLSAANSVLTEMFFTVVLCTGLWMLWRDTSRIERPWPYSLLSGLVCGSSVFIRPVSLFFFIPAGAYLVLARRSHQWRAALSFALAFAILPLLWAARNYYRTGHLTLSSVAEYNLLFYRAAGALAIEQPGDFPTNLDNSISELKAQACADLRTIYRQDCSQVPPSLASEYYSRLARRILLAHRLAYLRLVARGAAVMMLDGDATSLAGITGINPHLGVKLLLIYTVPAMCFAIIGWVGLWNENRRFCYLAGLVILYLVVISAGAEAYSRFRVPIVPIYVMLTAGGVDWILTLWSRRPRTPLMR